MLKNTTTQHNTWKHIKTLLLCFKERFELFRLSEECFLGLYVIWLSTSHSDRPSNITHSKGPRDHCPAICVTFKNSLCGLRRSFLNDIRLEMHIFKHIIIEHHLCWFIQMQNNCRKALQINKIIVNDSEKEMTIIKCVCSLTDALSHNERFGLKTADYVWFWHECFPLNLFKL